MKILTSAYRHGVSDDAIRHAWKHALGFHDIEPDHDPPKSLCIGPDPAGNLLEVLYFRTADDNVVIHAMRLRRTFRYFLTRGRR
ncbi:MAG: hypothetical protein OXG55_14155 [bacterium]|nr:hypothetical protein [bacterium]